MQKRTAASNYHEVSQWRLQISSSRAPSCLGQHALYRRGGLPGRGYLTACSRSARSTRKSSSNEERSFKGQGHTSEQGRNRRKREGARNGRGRGSVEEPEREHVLQCGYMQGGG